MHRHGPTDGRLLTCELGPYKLYMTSEPCLDAISIYVVLNRRSSDCFFFILLFLFRHSLRKMLLVVDIVTIQFFLLSFLFESCYLKCFNNFC